MDSALRGCVHAGGAGWALDPADIAALDRAFPAPDRDAPLGML